MFKPRPYTDYEIEDHRRHLWAEKGRQLVAKYWNEACAEVAHDELRDERIAKAFQSDDMVELGNLMKDAIERYIGEHFIQPELDAWAENFEQDQLEAYQEAVFERVHNKADF